MPVWTDIARTTSPRVKQLHTWWTEHRPEGDIPDRSALLPEQLAPMMPYVMITDIEPEPFRVRYRLVGTKVVANTGFDFTGRYLDEVQPESALVPWREYYRTVFDSRAPLMGAFVDIASAGGTFNYEFGIYPLRRGGSAVAQCIAVEDYFGFEAKSRQWER